jgi:hypothetical protein
MKKVTLFFYFVPTIVTVAIVLFMSSINAGATPPMQMTPGVDPMSQPTSQPPETTPIPGSAQPTPGAVNGSATCPMMNGSQTMGGMQSMGGMGGMGGMQGMGAMGSGMQGMYGTNITTTMGSQMGAMPMGSMAVGAMPMGAQSQTGNMPMYGQYGQVAGPYVNDVLSARTSTNWFYTINPWWILGWIVLFAVVISILGTGIYVLVRLLRKDKPPAAA